MSNELASHDCADCPIRHSAVCARCDADELQQLEAIKYYRSFEAGQTIAWAGDELGYVASVVRGVAKLSQTLEDGRTQMLGLLLPSDFIGRPGRVRNAYDVTAVSDITLCCFRRKPFEMLLATTPHISERLLTMTLDEDQLRAAMIESLMCSFSLDLPAIAARFDLPVDAIRERTAALRARFSGQIADSGNIIRLTQSSRLIARLAAQELDGFQMPEGRHSRAM